MFSLFKDVIPLSSGFHHFCQKNQLSVLLLLVRRCVLCVYVFCFVLLLLFVCCFLLLWLILTSLYQHQFSMVCLGVAFLVFILLHIQRAYWFSDIMSDVNLRKLLVSVFSKVAPATFLVSTPLDSIDIHKIFHCAPFVSYVLYSILHTFSPCFNLNIFY